VNTSPSLPNPSGYLGVYDINACLANMAACAPLRKIDLGGQPDSVAISPDKRYAAVIIENQRDEDVTVDGIEGGLPQAPAGLLVIVDLVGGVQNWATRNVDLTGLAAYGANDPEPEFVAINERNIAAVTLQENNHIALVDLRTGKVIRDFDAGTVSLNKIDTEEDGVIRADGSIADIPREPDSVGWLSSRVFVTANEGDLLGGSRGFTAYNTSGQVVFDAGNDFEHLAMRHGHYPESRSENKGGEPEGLTVGRYDGKEYLFVGSERGNFVAVYRTDEGKKEFVQLLPTGVGPEGLLAIPERDLFVVATETDDPIRSQVNIYRLERGEASYPQVVSNDKRGVPIGWGALSALAADRDNAKVAYTVHDSYYAESKLYTMRVDKQPAEIVDAKTLSKNGGPVNYDLEGLTQRANGGFWAVSEGAAGCDQGTFEGCNLLVKLAGDGTVLEEVMLPASVIAKQTSSGFEGVAVTGSGSQEKVYVAFQREWLGEPLGKVRIGEYTPTTASWRFFYYPIDAVQSPAGGWVGLSEIVSMGNNRFAVLERDNQSGPNARIKKIYTFSLAGITPVAEGGGPLPTVSKSLALDFLPHLKATKGWVLDKPEGFMIAKDGQAYIVTDNDGVEESLGETRLLRLGKKAVK
jgi:hypothetical protein